MSVARDPRQCAYADASMRIARIAIDVPLDHLFDYEVPADMPVRVGTRVKVPFGRKMSVGFVLELASAPAVAHERLKPVAALLEEEIMLPEPVLELVRFCHTYYHQPIGQVVAATVPATLRQARPLRRTEAWRFRLTAHGLAERDRIAPRQRVHRRIVDALASGPMAGPALRALSPRAAAAVRALIADGLIAEERVPAQALCAPAAAPGPQLNDDQRLAFEAISAAIESFGVWLLHGVTGSGKTEVYLRLIERTLARARQALMLVPEINLSPQLEERVRARFPDARLVTLHSGLGEGERERNWLRALRADADIVLGTRLSIFAPMPRLGLVVVDEENDESFKQQDGLRYSARDLAVFRARRAGVPVVLGSATPSLETYVNARRNRYRRLPLPRRALGSGMLPAVRVVDMRPLPGATLISAALRAALAARLERGEQSLVFLNRRGYAPVLACFACGWTSDCPRCAAKRVLHSVERRLRCHHCGSAQPVPAACPGCGNQDLRPLGHGTQRLEGVLRELLPTARMVRVDSDSARGRGAWADMREAIHQQDVDLLVGTQMLAKGHDFPAVTLVGIVDPDGALFSADFRASERLFAQLMQVAGRAGRADTPGEVLVQTRFPHHPLFHALARQEYDRFAEVLLAERRTAGFPPFVHQALLRAEAPAMETCLAFLQAAAGAGAAERVTIYDPVPAAMPKRDGKARAQLLVQSARRAWLQRFLASWYPQLAGLAAKRVRWSLDVDPLEF
jgi:primosomal protein N' (replication factor Y)